MCSWGTLETLKLSLARKQEWLCLAFFTKTETKLPSLCSLHMLCLVDSHYPSRLLQQSLHCLDFSKDSFPASTIKLSKMRHSCSNSHIASLLSFLKLKISASATRFQISQNQGQHCSRYSVSVGRMNELQISSQRYFQVIIIAISIINTQVLVLPLPFFFFLSLHRKTY